MDKPLDKLSNQAQITRLQNLLKVKHLVDLGVPVTKACREVGYPRSSYYVDIAKLARLPEQAVSA